MDLAITQVPLWVSLLFFVSFSTIPIFLIVRSLKQVTNDAGYELYSKLKRNCISFYVGFLTLVALVSVSGFFAENVLPPRIIVLVSLPLFLFYFFIAKRSSWFQALWPFIKIEHLVSIHLFRFVGVFFFLAYHFGAIPKIFALTGGIGDIVTAALVFPVLFVLRNKWDSTKIVVVLWNVIGLVDILLVLSSAVLLTKAAVETGGVGVQQFGTFPFSWIPAFAPATIIFLHPLIFKKLKEIANK